MNNPDLPRKTSPTARKIDDSPITEAHRLLLERQEVHIGPIPDGATFAKYESVLPGAADRLIKMAEKEQSHEHAQESKRLKYEALLALVGQFFAFVIGMTGIIGGVILVSRDKSLAGFGIFLTSLASLVGTYIYRCRKSGKTAGKEDRGGNVMSQ